MPFWKAVVATRPAMTAGPLGECQHSPFPDRGGRINRTRRIGAVATATDPSTGQNARGPIKRRGICNVPGRVP